MPSVKMGGPGSKLTSSAKALNRSTVDRGKPTNRGWSDNWDKVERLNFMPLIFPGAIAGANGCYFFRYVYTCGAPRDAPPAPYAPRGAELFPPPGELVGGPLPVT